MAANATDPDFTKEKENKLFIQMFGLSGLLLFLTVLADCLEYITFYKAAEKFEPVNI